MLRYATTIFLSAFLLFQVQPLIGKFILPWFGGTPSVWTTCMIFFQVALLAGYSYAHFITSRLSPRGQMVCHLALLAASLLCLPIAPNGDVWKSAGEEMPIGRILALLAATIGLPYFLLSSTGPLLQESFRRETGRVPYRLYSLSNIGSLLALLSYPFLFEPELTLRTQIVAWSIAYVVFVAFCGWCALGFTKQAYDAGTQPAAAVALPEGRAPGASEILLWLILAACGSLMLLATTNQLCQEVSSVPFLWVVPLSLYLTTFIICFDHERWYHRETFLVLLTGAIVGACYAIFEGASMPLWQQLALYSAALWVCCMVLHGELVRAKPQPRHATLFYLMVAAGGALGGILVGFVAPLVLSDYWEYQIGLTATVALAVYATMRKSEGGSSPAPARWIAGGMCVVLGLAVGYFGKKWTDTFDAKRTALETTRNFYGVLHVNLREDGGDAPRRELIHGRIQHGIQYLDDEMGRWPTTYYSRPSGVGIAIEKHPRREETEGFRIGVIGLGCGTLAVYGRKGDQVCFYEINPEVKRIANTYFTYLQECPGDVVVVMGDARIKMEQQLANGEKQQFDVLAVDAFSSDSIPMHLLTLECARLYYEHLRSDGILCLHISNRFLDLSGVTRGLAEKLGCEAVLIDASDDDEGGSKSSWVLVTTNWDFLNAPAVARAIQPWTDDYPEPFVWTDDYASLRQALDKDQLSLLLWDWPASSDEQSDDD